jgi:hypothetical protein
MDKDVFHLLFMRLLNQIFSQILSKFQKIKLFFKFKYLIPSLYVADIVRP